MTQEPVSYLKRFVSWKTLGHNEDGSIEFYENIIELENGDIVSIYSSYRVDRTKQSIGTHSLIKPFIAVPVID